MYFYIGKKKKHKSKKLCGFEHPEFYGLQGPELRRDLGAQGVAYRQLTFGFDGLPNANPQPLMKFQGSNPALGHQHRILQSQRAAQGSPTEAAPWRCAFIMHQSGSTCAEVPLPAQHATCGTPPLGLPSSLLEVFGLKHTCMECIGHRDSQYAWQDRVTFSTSSAC